MRPSVKCLLVDDLEENLLALAALLEQDGVQLLKARSGSEALELLLVNDIALALLDVQMPDMDGFQLAELMRGSERTRHVPIIFVTAGTHEPHRVFKGYEMGAVDFLHKPVDPLILSNKASVFFQLYRQKLQLAEDLKQRTETLRLNEMFVAILGHDLRTPLNTILTSAELLLKSSPANASAQEATVRIQSSGRRMQTLIENVLDLARARLAGGIALKREDMDLGQLMSATVREHESLAPGSPIEVSPSGDLRGHWDSDRLSQVLSNLIGNALKHGEPGQLVQVMLDGTKPDTVTLTITNLGGIAPEALPHVFDPFGAGRRPRARNEGLGLGLYIVRQIVDAHAGEIGVHVENHRRTVFRLALPRRAHVAVEQAGGDAPFPVRAISSRSLGDGGGGAPRTTRRILVVDDNRDSADSLGILLEMDGNQTRMAYDGLEALEMAGTFRPDVVVLDLGLPHLDGYQVAQRIRQEPWGQDMVLVALTGWDNEEDRRRTAKAGFDRHLVKPIDGIALQKILADLTRKAIA